MPCNEGKQNAPVAQTSLSPSSFALPPLLFSFSRTPYAKEGSSSSSPQSPNFSDGGNGGGRALPFVDPFPLPPFLKKGD